MSRARGLLRFFADARKGSNPVKFLMGTPTSSGRTLYLQPGEWTKSKPIFRADQGVYEGNGIYEAVVQENGAPHGETLAKTTVNQDTDSGDDVIERLENDARRRGNL